MTMSDTVAPVVVHGLRCGEPMHTGYGYGKVFCTSTSRVALSGLAKRNPCYELVQSTDAGHTWTRAEP